MAADYAQVIAAEFGARALTLCTVSDHILRGEQTSSQERQSTFNEMIRIALEAILLDDAAQASAI